MIDERDASRRIERLLREGTWTEPLGGVDVAGLSRRTRRRQVALAAAAGVGILGLVSVGAVAATQIGGRGDNGAATGAASSSVADTVPWIDARPPEQPVQDVKTCDAGTLSVTLGQTGVWHNMATQLVDIVNQSGEACAVPAQISIDVKDPDGLATSLDTAQLMKASLTLASGQKAALLLGADATCPDSVIAKNLDITVGEKSTFKLSGSWIPLSCGKPTAISMEAFAVEPQTQDVPLAAAIDVPSTLPAGQTAVFTVTLTNKSDQPIEFKDCPNYDVSLKRTPVLESHQLNCDEAGPIPAGGSTVFRMQIEVPKGAVGDDLLSWALNGYPAVVSVPVYID